MEINFIRELLVGKNRRKTGISANGLRKIKILNF
jgi:hypothetical protein